MLSLAIFLCALFGAAVSVQAAGWANTNFPYNTNGLTAASIGNFAYVAPGNNPLRSVEVYNATSGTFATWPDVFPTTLTRMSSATAGRRVIFAGGRNATGGRLADAFVLNVDTNAWTHVPNALQHGRELMTAFGVGTRYAVFYGGLGVTGTGYKTVMDVYDAQTDTWSAATIPVGLGPRLEVSGGAAGTHAVIVGGGGTGLGADYYLRRVDVYDTATGIYTNNTFGLNMARRSPATATFADGLKLMVAGGEGDDGSYMSSVEIYDSATGVFTLFGQSLTIGRQQPRAGTAPNGLIFIAGGLVYDNGNPTPRVDVFNTTTGTIVQTRPLLDARQRFAVVTAGSQLLFIAGYDYYSQNVATVDIYESDVYPDAGPGPNPPPPNPFCPSPCLNGGNCESTGAPGASYRCVCAPNWTGTTCTVYAPPSSTAVTADATGGTGATGQASGAAVTASAGSFVVAVVSITAAVIAFRA